MQISFVVHGKPIAKQSFRVVVREDNQGDTRKVSGYRDPRVSDWQNDVKYSAYLAMDGLAPFGDDLAVVIEFVLPDKRRIDLDNLSKAVLDGCNKVVWKDDRQIVDLHLKKTIGKNPHALVMVSSL
jgi:Holliday junction resolvase RusA-like endonuclease